MPTTHFTHTDARMQSRFREVEVIIVTITHRIRQRTATCVGLHLRRQHKRDAGKPRATTVCHSVIGLHGNRTQCRAEVKGKEQKWSLVFEGAAACELYKQKCTSHEYNAALNTEGLISSRYISSFISIVLREVSNCNSHLDNWCVEKTTTSRCRQT